MNVVEVYKILKNNSRNVRKSIVFDIDNTIIDLDGNRIEQIVDIYDFCKVLRYNIFIVTARQGDKTTMEITKQQLFDLNLEGYNMIFFCPIGQMDIEKYKETCRKLIYKMGYDTVMSIGDMYWDVGKYGGIGVLVDGS